MVLELKNIDKSFGEKEVLKGVSFTAEGGKAFGLLGRNGAGKTTSIRILMNVFPANSGEVLIDGKPIDYDKIGIGYLPEERGLYKKMKVGEQAIFFARLKGLSRREAVVRLKEWFVRLGIESWWNRKVEDLSKGMAQKVQFITTVLHEPKLLIFDEPFSGFDPINANLLKQEILRLRDKGATVIFSTHNMSSVEEICDHITLINKSRNILSGSVDEIRRTAGGNIFELLYRANDEAFKNSLGDLAMAISESRGTVGGYTQTRIHIPKDEDVRRVIAKLNDECELRSLNEVMPSMNDIFIRAVNGSL